MLEVVYYNQANQREEVQVYTPTMDVPTEVYDNVVKVTARGEGYEHIKINFVTIPYRVGSAACVWRGDLAKFILMNWNSLY